MVHARLNSEVRTSRLVTLAATMLNAPWTSEPVRTCDHPVSTSWCGASYRGVTLAPPPTGTGGSFGVFDVGAANGAPPLCGGSEPFANVTPAVTDLPARASADAGESRTSIFLVQI